MRVGLCGCLAGAAVMPWFLSGADAQCGMAVPVVGHRVPGCVMGAAWLHGGGSPVPMEWTGLVVGLSASLAWVLLMVWALRDGGL